ncbi:ISL3 family transposase [Bacteroides sp.]
MPAQPNRNKVTIKTSLNNDFGSIFTNNNSLVSIYDSSDIDITGVCNEGNTIFLYAQSSKFIGVCPYCGSESHQVHSRYVRKINDLSILGRKVVLLLDSRKFFCKNTDCSKKTFAEQPGNEVFRYRRRTRRLELTVIRNGLMMSSQTTSKLLSFCGVDLSSSTILRCLHQLHPSDYKGIESIGVDDWAWRKGLSYGTIIIDLLNRHPIDLLCDREEQSFRGWMEEHKQVNLVSRDRSTDYSSAIASTGRDVVEIADKFHLIKNMQERMSKLLSEHYADYRNKIREKESMDDCLLQQKQTSITNVHPKQSKEDSRMIKFKEVKELQRKGFTPFAISKKLGIAQLTATKYYRMQELPPQNSKERNSYHLYDKYVEDGVTNGTPLSTLYIEICKGGFKGCQRLFYEHYKYLSDGHRGFRSKYFKPNGGVKLPDERSRILPLKRISAIIGKSICQGKINKSEEELIGTLSEFSWFKQMYDAAKSFYSIITGTETDKLIRWMKEYWNTNVQTLKTFLLGIRKDYKAVKNTIKYNITNGITEGFVNKLKVVKRNMYGRAGLELLRIKMVIEHVFLN